MSDILGEIVNDEDDIDNDFDPNNVYNSNMPSTFDFVDVLVDEYDSIKANILHLESIFKDPKYILAMKYYEDYNDYQRRSHKKELPYSDSSGAIKCISAAYWNRALRSTDIVDYLPAKRLHEWNDQIREMEVPEFEDDIVRDNIRSMLLDRGKYFAERVDGVFTSLSRKHVTNQPEGFSKRMIVNGVIGSYGFTEYRKVDILHDLRLIVAKLMQREEPSRNSTSDMIDWLRTEPNGSWQTIDSGALSMRLYGGVGTIHIDIHPQLAWKMNAILSTLYPNAIPESARRKPKKETAKSKSFTLMEDVIPFPVLSVLSNLERSFTFEKVGYRDSKKVFIPNTYNYRCQDKHVCSRVDDILKYIGGTKTDIPNQWYFDYDPEKVCKYIAFSGVLPDSVSHQYYPTPDIVSEYTSGIVNSIINGNDSTKVLEPSAGTGSLIKNLEPCDLAVCEISPLHCKILDARFSNLYGDRIVNKDFLKYNTTKKVLYDVVICNPPFSGKRFISHTQHSINMLKDDGICIAVLPLSASNVKWENCKVEKLNQFDGDFEDTQISVGIYKFTKV